MEGITDLNNGVVLFIDVGIRYTVHYIGIYLN